MANRRVRLFRRSVEVQVRTSFNIFFNNFYVIITIWSGMFMVKSQSMHHFMGYGAFTWILFLLAKLWLKIKILTLLNMREIAN